MFGGGERKFAGQLVPRNSCRPRRLTIRRPCPQVNAAIAASAYFAPVGSAAARTFNAASTASSPVSNLMRSVMSGPDRSSACTCGPIRTSTAGSAPVDTNQGRVAALGKCGAVAGAVLRRGFALLAAPRHMAVSGSAARTMTYPRSNRRWRFHGPDRVR